MIYDEETNVYNLKRTHISLLKCSLAACNVKSRLYEQYRKHFI